MRPWTAARLAFNLPTRRCFNGATALRPWTAKACCSLATWGQGFNGATALRPWTDISGGAAR